MQMIALHERKFEFAHMVNPKHLKTATSGTLVDISIFGWKINNTVKREWLQKPKLNRK
jgi:hypothetical protein